VFFDKNELFADEDELRLFVDFELFGKAERPDPDSLMEKTCAVAIIRAKKNPTQPISGAFVVYSQPDQKKRGKNGIRKGPANMRGSDLSMRLYLDIFAMRWWKGMTLVKALEELTERLDRLDMTIKWDALKARYDRFRSYLKESSCKFRSSGQQNLSVDEVSFFLLVHEVSFFRSWVETIRRNVWFHSISVVRLADIAWEDACKRGCDEEKATSCREKYVDLANRALSMLSKDPLRVWDPVPSTPEQLWPQYY
jgi:hypothetical protein